MKSARNITLKPVLRLLAFLTLLSTHDGYAAYKYNLAVCAIFQDEAPYLKEWIEFHRLVGVEHFYLYNHRSKDHYREVLKPYILSGLVEVIDKPKVAHRIKIFNRLQCKCYNECLARTRGICKWVAFIDIDEYLFPVQERSLLEVLKQYEEFGGLYANWHLFGTSHLHKIPSHQLLVESLTLCTPKSFPANRYVKSIVKPEHASHFPNPHHPIYFSGYYQVNTDKIPFDGPFLSSYIQTNKLKINHYWTRDEEFFYQKKIPRHKKWGGQPIAQDILNQANKEKDESILRFVPALKQALK
jgi:hypothetical protein